MPRLKYVNQQNSLCLQRWRCLCRRVQIVCSFVFYLHFGVFPNQALWHQRQQQKQQQKQLPQREDTDSAFTWLHLLRSTASWAAASRTARSLWWLSSVPTVFLPSLRPAGCKVQLQLCHASRATA